MEGSTSNTLELRELGGFFKRQISKIRYSEDRRSHETRSHYGSASIGRIEAHVTGRTMGLEDIPKAAQDPREMPDDLDDRKCYANKRFSMTLKSLWIRLGSFRASPRVSHGLQSSCLPEV